MSEYVTVQEYAKIKGVSDRTVYRMNDKLKLGMTPEEVKEILGEPDDIEKEGWELIFHYQEPNKKRSITFFYDVIVVSVSAYGIGDGWSQLKKHEKGKDEYRPYPHR